MKTLLFCDLLGMKRVWQDAGAEAARERFDAFAQMVTEVARRFERAKRRTVHAVEIESDAAAVVLADEVTGIMLAVRLWRSVFSRGSPSQGGPTYWVRGAIVRAPVESRLRSRQESDCGLMIRNTIISKELAEAIHVEKSGFRGMRLLVDGSLLTQEVRASLRDAFWVGSGAGSADLPFATRRLNHSVYPSIKGRSLEDVLWPMDARAAFEKRRDRLAQRLKYAAKDPEELAQAACTQVLFNEIESILYTTGVTSISPRAR